MSNTGDRRAHRHHEKIGVDESEDIQIGDRRAGISHYRIYRHAEKLEASRADDESLDEASEDIVALENPEAWKIWKNMLLTNQPKMQEFGSQMAVYMHCMLQ